MPDNNGSDHPPIGLSAKRRELERLLAHVGGRALTEVVENDVEALAVLTSADTALMVASALERDDPAVRRAWIRALIDRRPPDVVESLSQLVRNGDTYTRAVASEALGATGDPHALRPLQEALEDPMAAVRAGAAQGLGLLQDPRALAALEEMLDDASPDVRRWAVWALGELGLQHGLSLIEEAEAFDEDPDVQVVAGFAARRVRRLLGDRERSPDPVPFNTTTEAEPVLVPEQQGTDTGEAALLCETPPSWERSRRPLAVSGSPTRQRGHRGPRRRRGLKSTSLVLTAVSVVCLVMVRAQSAGALTRSDNPPTLCSRDLPDGLVVAAAWEGREAENFEKVLNRFRRKSRAKVVYASGTHDIARKLKESVENGCPPAVALLPQPGLLEDLVKRGDLLPIDSIAGEQVRENYSPGWRQLGTVDENLYGVWFKAANKSIIWYNNSLFARAGVSPPKTWDELKHAAARLAENGITPFALGAGGDSAWTLTDWFENVYLRTADNDMYDKLAGHCQPRPQAQPTEDVRWTDPSVKHALAILAEVLGEQRWLAGGVDGALSTSFDQSVMQVFGDRDGNPPEAAMISAGDFAATNIQRDTKAKLGEDARFFEFPAIGESGQPVVLSGVKVEPGTATGGDVAVLLKQAGNDPPAKHSSELVRFLAEPEAAEPWVKEGGFISPNRKVELDVYREGPLRDLAMRLREITPMSARFDLSDQQPSEFGAMSGQGMWEILRNYLRNPVDVDGTAQLLEEACNRSSRR